MTGSAGFRTSRLLLARALSLCALAGIGALPACLHSAERTMTTAPGVSYRVVVTGLAGPRGLLFSPSGDLYVVEQASGAIARISPEGQVARIAEGLSDSHDLARDARGNLYVAEAGRNRVVRISPEGAVMTYIAGLSLRNGLAILSACETALGEQVPGAALITLAAAFSQAGAQSILASLWSVNDAAARDFMVAFHRALPTAGRAAAFQQAQVPVLSSPATAHPYYWAPFILIGAR